jgi:hypothetical protein
MTKQEIKNRIWELHDKINEMFNKSIEIENGWEIYKNMSEHKEVANLEREYKLMMDETDIEYSPIPDYGDKMTFEHFVECCEDGGFIDYDGFGYYATNDKETNIQVYPSDIMSGKYRKDFSYVIWYNR